MQVMCIHDVYLAHFTKKGLLGFSYTVFGNDNVTFSWKILCFTSDSKSLASTKQTSVGVGLGSSSSSTMVNTVKLD